jgi:hypothetical protein
MASISHTIVKYCGTKRCHKLATTDKKFPCVGQVFLRGLFPFAFFFVVFFFRAFITPHYALVLYSGKRLIGTWFVMEDLLTSNDHYFWFALHACVTSVNG